MNNTKNNVKDYETRIKLKRMVGLPPIIRPDSDGLDKTKGLLSDITQEGFDAVEFVKSMRERV